MRYRAVFFDFDGTIADSYDAIAASVNHVRALRGHPALATTDVKRHVGRGPDYLLTATVPGTDLEEDYQRYRAHHVTVMVEKTWLLPGADEALRAIKRSGRKVALCSNKPRLFSNELLKRLGVADLFDAIVGPEDVPDAKPAPDMILKAMATVGVEASEVLYIGDMTVDIQTARAANVDVWIVPTGSDTIDTLIAAKPDRMLADLHELTAACA